MAREKLIELLDKGPAEYAVGSEGIADYLIANGVTVQNWIPVTERLPEEKDADARGYVLAIAKSDGCINAHAYHAVSRFPNLFTHWMTMPSLPEGENQCSM